MTPPNANANSSAPGGSQRQITLEVCVDRLGDAIAAAEAGADRLELCSSLEVGGLTPSAGLLKAVLAETDADVVAMIRPRAGGFCYDRRDLQTACREAEEALAAGAAGIVFGALRNDGAIDADATRRLADLAGAAETVFHRAFDFVPDAAAALDTLIDLGVTRVLTSGGAATALEGAARLRKLVEQAGGRIEVMPGAGIGPDNVLPIVEATGCNQVHMGLSLLCHDDSLDRLPHVEFRTTSRYAGGAYRAVDVQKLRQAADLLHSADLAGRRSHPSDQ